LSRTWGVDGALAGKELADVEIEGVIQNGLSLAGCFLKGSVVIDEPTNRIKMSLVHRQMQRRFSGVGLCVDQGSLSDQDLHGFKMASQGRPMKGSIQQKVDRIHIDESAHESLDQPGGAESRSVVKRRVSLPILKIWRRTKFDQAKRLVLVVPLNHFHQLSAGGRGCRCAHEPEPEERGHAQDERDEIATHESPLLSS